MAAVQLKEVREKAESALKAVEADKGASPVLRAVVRELATKAAKAVDLGVDREWEAVVDVEQAGDSAKAGAEADAGAAEATTSSILAAHMAVCMLKASLAKTE